MKCPECQIKMSEVKTSSHYGIPMVLDQCPECGGLWFDESELYRTKHGVAQRIEKRLDAGKLRKFALMENRMMHCPRDNMALKKFSDSHGFKDIQIDICPECGGLWFNYGDFTKFQDARTKKMQAFQERKAEKLSKEQEKVLDKEFDKKVVNLLKLYSQIGINKERERKKGMAETVMYLIWILLRILFRK
ncbi:zf-TFIIB domain-containing protein [Patescibacteria group bacterium]|nr:zf-TFIIB domain-containing protein [Patescibacteria group bacterium]MBU4601199.1 zf-TFIIB domain-containing protein [Patescibacteria group bacterium]MCG2698236.1 zf-TFIIB domain-containing protein [Candidatus Parcubacteria bacterium]